MTKRQAIVKDLIDIMKTILKENGYKTDSGEVVLHWVPKVLPEEEAEIINVKDSEAEFTDRFGGSRHNPKMLVSFEIACSKSTPEETWEYLTFQQADIYKCIGQNFENLRRKYGELKIEPFKEDLNIDVLDHVIGEGLVSILIEYSTYKWLKDEPEYN